jgi:hypothetical protein
MRCASSRSTVLGVRRASGGRGERRVGCPDREELAAADGLLPLAGCHDADAAAGLLRGDLLGGPAGGLLGAVAVDEVVAVVGARRAGAAARRRRASRGRGGGGGPAVDEGVEVLGARRAGGLRGGLPLELGLEVVEVRGRRRYYVPASGVKRRERRVAAGIGGPRR